MVQPLLDYCSQLWSPQKNGIIQNLETVQRSFTRNIKASLGYDSPRMFNSLPQDIRNKTGCSVHNFKKELDKFLKTLPDEPPVQGYTANCRAASNSIPDQMDLLRRDARDGSSGGAPRL
ncbi:hypothetical protein Pcinc_011225 [Petrolisthes cinctipes]|uniref:Uncharacterized protein n=1 Tax=Petrolisthes cinctipes TaxID=88211 RepID=A0AAE1G7B1_PETCI|nr:hypothetical protein Pcinc_011225 [Petrolisthes cinctipes]